MIRKTIFIAVVVLLVFFIYRGISPSWADKIINKISSIRQNTKNQTWTTNTWWNLISGTLLSWSENSYERLTQSWTLENLSWTSETLNTTWTANTWSQKTVVNNTWKTNTWTTTKPPVKTTNTTKTTTQTTTNTNWLSEQDMKDFYELNNIIE